MNNDLYIIKIDSFGKETIVYLEQEREFNGWIRIKFYEDFIYFYYQINEQDITLKIFDLNWNIQKELLIEGLRDIRYSKDNEFVYEFQDENKDYYLVKMNVNGEQLFKLGPYERMYSITILDSGFQYEYSKNGFYFATQIDRNGQEVSKLGPYESYEDLKARDYIENVCDGNCTHQVLMKTRDNELIISKMENNKSYLMKIDHRENGYGK